MSHSTGPAGEKQEKRLQPRPQSLHRRGIWSLVTAAEMQALDRQTIDRRGVPGEILMESAGRSLLSPTLSLRRESERSGAAVRAVCGVGNNGGDGFVLVRHLCAEGIAAEAILIGDPERLQPDAASNWARLERAGCPRRVVDPEDSDFDWAALLADTSVAIDALFGTGLKREIRGGFARLIDSLASARRAGLRVLSVDLPSGIDADTGSVLGTAIVADRTVTISLPKIGLALEPGASHAGGIVVARVGIDDPDPQRLPRVELWNAIAAAERFPSRAGLGRAAHKGSFGHVLVVAGSSGKTGAAVLCARAAARAGAGLVTLAHPCGVESELGALPAEVMSAPVAATPDGHFARAGEKAIEELLASRDVVALGPGIGLDSETVDLIRRLVVVFDRPMVVDADGLNALQGQLELLHERATPAILTPHPGEAARLLDTTAGRLNADRVGAACELAELSRSIVVLKGARTVVANPQRRSLIIPTGGPVLASGGTGDVLTGIIAALLAAGQESFEAAALAAWWHGATADRLPASRVGFGLLASELADALPASAATLVAYASDRAGRAVDSPVEPETEKEELGGDLDLRFPGP
ncbi:MAG: NAD(P)H-hydrate dehydratase [bacterium]|nr:bifunctional ADP-dependent NAD(P)H-hydrate dehydratase/NAD(P)H-hydrate epimerase [Deltaproteobacteria bacterium]MCP4908387.1 NAD(P)H-hydrate dehydratase [bacterium]